jgi:hypothetical protein
MIHDARCAERAAPEAVPQKLARARKECVNPILCRPYFQARPYLFSFLQIGDDLKKMRA